MPEKFRNKYRIPSNRLQGFDFGSHGMYFVTICTKDRMHYFGEIVETDNYPSLPNANNLQAGNCPSIEQSENYPPSDTNNKAAQLCGSTGDGNW